MEVVCKPLDFLAFSYDFLTFFFAHTNIDHYFLGIFYENFIKGFYHMSRLPLLISNEITHEYIENR